MIKTLFVVAAAMIAAPALAQTPATDRPMCSAKVTDGCQQTAAQQARAMSGAQADARDARAGGTWAPDKAATPKKAPAKKK
jgi:hypothetical protein